MTTDTIISKVWSFCTTLRDNGVGYDDYLERLTYLIFLKMADEYGRPPYKRDVGVPKKYAWATLRPLKGAELEVHYVEILRALGTEKGMLGQIFTKAQNPKDRFERQPQTYRLLNEPGDSRGCGFTRKKQDHRPRQARSTHRNGGCHRVGDPRFGR